MKAYQLSHDGIHENYDKWKFAFVCLYFILFLVFAWKNPDWLKEALPDMPGHTFMYQLIMCILFYMYASMFGQYLDKKYLAWRKRCREEAVQELWEVDPEMMQRLSDKVDTLIAKRNRCDEIIAEANECRSAYDKQLSDVTRIIAIHSEGQRIINNLRNIGAQRGIL